MKLKRFALGFLKVVGGIAGTFLLAYGLVTVLMTPFSFIIDINHHDIGENEQYSIKQVFFYDQGAVGFVTSRGDEVFSDSYTDFFVSIQCTTPIAKGRKRTLVEKFDQDIVEVSVCVPTKKMKAELVGLMEQSKKDGVRRTYDIPAQ